MRTWKICVVIVIDAAFIAACGAAGDPPPDETTEGTGGGSGSEIAASSGGSAGTAMPASGGAGPLGGNDGAGGAKAGASGRGESPGSSGATGSEGAAGASTGGGGAANVNAGPNKGSLACDGTSGQVVIPAASDLFVTGDWTVEGWFKDEDPAGGGNFNHDSRYILAKDGEKEAPYRLGVKYGGLTAGHIANWNKEDVTFSLNGAAITASTWHHAAASFEASGRRIRVYVDGQLKSDPLGPSTVLPTTLGTPDQAHPLTVTLCSYIAANPPYMPMGYWLGKIDDLRVWNVRRTDQEIADNYVKPLSGLQNGLLGYWTFDEGSGNIAHDLSGRGHDGALKTGASFSTDLHP